ncbi:RNA polymerase sigma factor SigA [Acaryochloris thomasi RCC1774]|uniref:RNA polymerase sigma factor SigA n=1 Tax=Acaryochloris thomasi RCC1774 TaxID=1764569 RepID=A0A2W1J6T9_9CYAN|nr:sigma-70 family RNA polymerase sigma factor [Acaryochloris thomasi]PZD70270.1 RNA polymerase sigma factor SigA [Acaryochloris thomasi RCC1774]
MIKSPPLELIRAAQANDRRARDRVFSASYEFVSMIAKRWSSRYAWLEYDDCLQAGFEGIPVAIERFDFSEGVQFFTYAKYAVSNSIQKLKRAEEKQHRTYEKAVSAYSVPIVEPLSWISEAQYNRSLRRRIYRALKSFSRLLRKWVFLRLLGRSYVSIAERFNVTRHQVATEVKAAMQVLRRRLFPKAYRFKQSLKTSLTPGQVTRHKPVPAVSPTPIQAVFNRLRTLSSGLLKSVQKRVSRAMPAFRLNSKRSSDHSVQRASSPVEAVSAPGFGRPPPPG